MTSPKLPKGIEKALTVLTGIAFPNSEAERVYFPIVATLRREIAAALLEAEADGYDTGNMTTLDVPVAHRLRARAAAIREGRDA